MPVAAVCAPFQHVHPDDHATAHHDGPAVHAHVAPHTHDAHEAADSGQPVLGDVDHDRAVPLQVVVAVPQGGGHIAPALPPALDPLARPERPAHVSVVVVHGHDPPVASLLASRAPPARLS